MGAGRLFIYIYKTIVSFLMPPGILFLAMLWLCWRLFKKRRPEAKWLAVVTAIFYVLSMPYVGDRLMETLEARYAPPTVPTGDVIIMLGGGATFGTPDVDGLGQLSGNAANRLLTAARLQRQLGVPVILSGGQVYEDTGREAVIGKRIMAGIGIAEDQIIVEDTSLNTQQNAANVRQIIAEKRFTQPILVTSAFHMPRSVLNFKKQGIAVTPYPSDYFVNQGGDSFYIGKWVPSADALRSSYIALHEYLGILAAAIY